MALGLPLNICTGIIKFDLLPTPSVVTNKTRVMVAADRNQQGGQKAYWSSLRSPDT